MDIGHCRMFFVPTHKIKKKVVEAPVWISFRMLKPSGLPLPKQQQQLFTQKGTLHY